MWIPVRLISLAYILLSLLTFLLSLDKKENKDDEV